MATVIDARVKQKNGVGSVFSGFYLLDGEIALVREEPNGPVINFKVGPGLFDTLPWSLSYTPPPPLIDNTLTLSETSTTLNSKFPDAKAGFTVISKTAGMKYVKIDSSDWEQIGVIIV